MCWFPTTTTTKALFGTPAEGPAAQVDPDTHWSYHRPHRSTILPFLHLYPNSLAFGRYLGFCRCAGLDRGQERQSGKCLPSAHCRPQRILQKSRADAPLPTRVHVSEEDISLPIVGHYGL
ncbi:uncharacterized protein LOC121103828 isoform X2 [Ursus maritimus]|uniref:Uncharacterized protein LOC121103828 isoform X2 n=1 Tax=Ursus maritimus TaxID=29073 RepID=A0A8M1GHN4_URSMA|nr:uncharacterized protein LOC121103828 isoform X2 [Ursus maritimus]XP_040491385.1 uncharacterized protein LOC121103828 isoform X2 [Ursus maritimus]